MKGEHSGINLARHIRGRLEYYGILPSRILGITTDNASNNYIMASDLSGLLAEESVQWDAAKYHVPCMAHVIQLVLGAFMKSLGVKSREKSWGAAEKDRQFAGEDEDMGPPEDNAKKVSKLFNARADRVGAMTKGFNKIVEKV